MKLQVFHRNDGRVRGMRRQLMAATRKLAHHDLRIHEVLRGILN